MAEQIKSTKPVSALFEEVSREFAISLLDLEDTPIFIVRNLRISSTGIDAKVIAKIDGYGNQKDMKVPFQIYYNGKFVAEELTEADEDTEA